MTYHILNGDALNLQFPQALAGTILVMRECLVDGPVAGATLQAFYQTRETYLKSAYAGNDIPSYATDVIPEFERMLAIPAGSTIHLWFEDDLFCQLNLYFTLHLLTQVNRHYALSLVRPEGDLQDGFGGMGQAGLIQAYHDRQPIPTDDWYQLAQLWPMYQAKDYDGMKQLAQAYAQDYPFLLPAIEAEISRYPADGSEGKHIAAIRSIVEHLQTSQLGPVFQAFSKEYSIYGLGDLQVEALLKQIS